ncbi:carboxymuconolactone decarboxylase family protein [Arthrobacter sp. M2012083]|uniref:carboxymuconolactone decarboxylase family protein n=1 Tax=Arthrobacter sp. M2012083 TaxID=1197706 RepID=UPI00031DF978|nr:carboxymuconolactone decarboxylase family protein [Arthrobacter sp. M2012083]
MFAQHPNIHNYQADSSRYERGMQALKTLSPATGPKVVTSLAGVAPALAEHMVAFGYGDVYAGTALSPSQRQLVTLGILTALGGCEAQLDFHLNASLNVGLSPAEIIEALTQSAVYCGFPRALNAVFVAKRVFTERGLLPANSSNGFKAEEPTQEPEPGKDGGPK